ncbi:MAG: winged helix-turn-helix transcriptional regulator [Methanogenium sp.]|jgi:DNA-binding transcriptional ArsR family regulator
MIQPRLSSLVFILVILTAMTHATTAVETGGYVVEPAYDIYPEYSDVYFTPRSEETILLNEPEPTPIRLAELPPGILVILGIAAVTPGAVYLGKHITATNIPVIGGFQRVSRKNIFDNSSRERVFCCIKEHPGAQLSDLKRSTGFSYKNLAYHLDILASFNVITLEKCKNTTRYFKNSDKFSGEEQVMLMHLSHSSDKMIIETILHHPGISRRDISDKIGISGPSVSWHMRFLVDDRIIEQRKEGTVARHYITEEMLRAYESVATRASAAV